MLADNNTPFAAIGFEHRHRDGPSMAIIAVRASYLLNADGSLEVAPKQQIILSDVYEGHPHTSPFLKPGDLIPFKPSADITILANAHSPENKPALKWHVGFAVNDAHHALTVHAPRAWKWAEKDWQLVYHEGPVSQVPLDYRHACSGSEQLDLNPLGIAPLSKDNVQTDKLYLAPQLENPLDPLSHPFQGITPESLAPVPLWWPWRLHHVGTTDDDWVKTRAPQHPRDFDYRYYQNAHPELIWQSYFEGGERIKLQGLTPGGVTLSFLVPSVKIRANFDFIDGRQVSARLNCDGLHIDLREGPPWSVDITYRGWVEQCPQFWKIDLFECDEAEAATLLHCGEHGVEESGG